MIFEVFKDGKRMFVTETARGVPDAETQRRLAAGGYKLKLDGKACKPGKAVG